MFVDIDLLKNLPSQLSFIVFSNSRKLKFYVFFISIID